MGKQQSWEFTLTVSTTWKGDAAVQAYAQPSKVRLNPRLISQSLQFTKVTINSQYFQAKPRRCSYRVALSNRLIEFTLPRLLMLEPICLTPPPQNSNKHWIIGKALAWEPFLFSECIWCCDNLRDNLYPLFFLPTLLATSWYTAEFASQVNLVILIQNTGVCCA